MPRQYVGIRDESNFTGGAHAEKKLRLKKTQIEVKGDIVSGNQQRLKEREMAPEGSVEASTTQTKINIHTFVK